MGPCRKTLYGRHLGRAALLFVLLAFLPFASFGQDDEFLFNAFGLKTYTIESRHFTIHFADGLEHIARDAGAIFESLYPIFSQTYGLTLPAKTKVLILDGEITNGLADYFHNYIVLWSHGFDEKLRGSHDWLKDVIPHEYAHILSINASMKLPSSIPVVQFGYFNHPNEPFRVEAIHYFPNTILPMWLAEGIAQYESEQMHGDAWDSHRDMILRTLTLSNRLLSWDRMAEFTGKGDDYEKTYNHGFSLVKYIAETYGHDKLVALVKETSRFFRLDFNGSVKTVLGISGPQLYAEWVQSLQRRYNAQVKNLGKQAYGGKINQDGFYNYWPKFSPDGSKLFFVSNGKADFSSKATALYSYRLCCDTMKPEKRIKEEKGISGFYSIQPLSGLIAYTSMNSLKSVMPANKGGDRTYDAYIDTLPPDTAKFALFKRKTKRQVTEKQRVFEAVFSPTGDKLACAKRIVDKFYLCLTDTNGKNSRILYPDTLPSSHTPPISHIYSLDWSNDGRRIVISYLDAGYRKIGVYDTLAHTFMVMNNSGWDDRDPRFGPDGKDLYFSSDRTGIFNIYRRNSATGTLQRLTNVSGGAFAPDVSKNGKKLAYANYDKDGFGIYLIDTLFALQESREDSFLVAREPAKVNAADAEMAGQVRPYVGFPTMFLIAPTFIVEQTVPEISNVFQGRTTFKAGAFAYLEDPLNSINKGTQIGAYLLLEPNKITQFINFDQGFFGRKVNYDCGAFVSTKTLPVALNLDFSQRGITGSDYFYMTDDSLGSAIQQQLNYSITLRYADLILSHPLGNGVKVHALASYNWYEVYLLIGEAFANYQSGYKDLSYSLAQGYRSGMFLSFLAPELDQRMYVSPKGLAAKIQYNYWNQDLLNEKGITVENGKLKENFDTYKYHEIGGSLKFGMPAPWYELHDFYAEAYGTAILTHEKLTNALFGTASGKKDLPSYYKPVQWLKGYTYFFRDTLKTADGKTDSVFFDTALVTGNAVALVNLSYRFPLWPGLQIGKKLWFINLDQFYGAINFSMGAGWQRPTDLFKFRREDWLSSAGGELRLFAQSFGMPLAIGLRYDYGLNKTAPYGGDRVTLTLGFSFDNWSQIEIPDYYATLATR
jgi:Tol biopolymer transport system component